MKTLSYNWKLLLLSVLTVALLGQSLTAAASSCAMMEHDDSSSQMQSMEHHDHAMHGSAMAAAMEQTGHHGSADCCAGGGGYCSMLSCVTVVELLNTSHGVGLMPNAALHDFTERSAPSIPRSRLYKPPISA